MTIIVFDNGRSIPSREFYMKHLSSVTCNEQKIRGSIYFPPDKRALPASERKTDS